MSRVVLEAKGSDLDFLPNTRKIAGFAAEHHAIDIRAYDLRGLTVIADSFVICSASSAPHFKAILNSILEGMKSIGVAPLHKEGTLKGGWLVVDYGSIIVHIFREEARKFYDLDDLWGDAPQIDVGLQS